MVLAIIITSFFIIGSLVLKGKFINDVFYIKYILNIIIFSLAILCFAFLVNNITGNKLVINGISTVLSLGMSFISGVMVPQELLSEKALMIARFFPSYYFVKINESNINSLLEIKEYFIIQLLFGIGFLVLGLLFSRIRQKN